MAKVIKAEFTGGNRIWAKNATPIEVVVVLQGGFMFAADLLRQIKYPCNVHFARIYSYGNSTASSGTALVQADDFSYVKGKVVLVVDDIIDTGISLSSLSRTLLDSGASSLKLCCLLDKPSRRKVDIELSYPAITIPDKFVYGYGMDLEGNLRNLPDIHVKQVP